MIRHMLAPVLALALLFAVSAKAAGPAPPPDIKAVSAALAGLWQSADDPKFTREFDLDGNSVDRYEGDASESISGHWTIFLGSAPPSGVTGHRFQPNVVYLRLDQNGDVLLFALAALSRSELKMVYLERGNLLSFLRLK
jgi:hypothetical protein